MKKLIALFTLATTAAMALAGCAAGQGQVDVSTSHTATFPGITPDAAKLLPPGDMTTNAAVTLDVSKDIAQLSGYGKITATISKDSVEGSDLAFIHRIKATILTTDGKLPAVLLADVEVPANSQEVPLTALISNDQILNYLAEGQVSLEFELTGAIPAQPVTLTHSLVAHLDVAMQGSLKL